MEMEGMRTTTGRWRERGRASAGVAASRSVSPQRAIALRCLSVLWAAWGEEGCPGWLLLMMLLPSPMLAALMEGMAYRSLHQPLCCLQQ